MESLTGMKAVGTGVGGGGVSVPMRGGGGAKKMKKRRELDALAKRCGVPAGAGGVGAGAVTGTHRRSASGGLSSHDQLLSETSEDDSWVGGGGGGGLGDVPGHGPGVHALGGYSHPHGYSHGGYLVAPQSASQGKKRRGPPGGSRVGRVPTRTCSHAVRVCTVMLISACVLATTTVMWLFVGIREQTSALRVTVQQVVAGTSSVPDDLQKIHTLSRQLQQNQTLITSRIDSVATRIANLSDELSGVQAKLRAVDERLQLQSAPELVNVKELSTSVAQWGSQIKDLDNTVRSLKQQGAALEASAQSLRTNVSAVEASVSQLVNASLRPAPLDPNVAHDLDSISGVLAQVVANVSLANSTLSERLWWLQDDQLKDHKLIVGLQELGQNMTAIVKTLEGECAKNDKQLNDTVLRLAEQVKADEQRLSVIEQSIPSPRLTTLQAAPTATRSSTSPAPSPLGSIIQEKPEGSLPDNGGTSTAAAA